MCNSLYEILVLSADFYTLYTLKNLKFGNLDLEIVKAYKGLLKKKNGMGSQLESNNFNSVHCVESSGDLSL